MNFRNNRTWLVLGVLAFLILIFSLTACAEPEQPVEGQTTDSSPSSTQDGVEEVSSETNN